MKQGDKPGAIVETVIDGVLVERGWIDEDGKWHDLIELLQTMRIEPFHWGQDEKPEVPFLKQGDT